MNALALLLLLTTPALSEEWTCTVAYDEVNGGGTFTISDDVMAFVSNWPHRRPETLKCLRVGQTSECLGGKLSPTESEGASAFLKLYSIVWEPDGGPGEQKHRRGADGIGAPPPRRPRGPRALPARRGLLAGGDGGGGARAVSSRTTRRGAATAL